jgi:hypothetical protein
LFFGFGSGVKRVFVYRCYEDIVRKLRLEQGRRHLLHIVARHEDLGSSAMDIASPGQEVVASGLLKIIKKFSNVVEAETSFESLSKRISDFGIEDWDLVFVSAAYSCNSNERKVFLDEMEKKIFAGEAGDICVFSRENKPLAPAAALNPARKNKQIGRVADKELVRKTIRKNDVSDTSIQLLDVGGEVYKVKHNKRHRVLVKYGENYKALIWFSISSDGSIYVGHCIENIEAAKIGVSKSINGSAFVDYDSGKDVDIEKIKPVTKVTIHASGCVHVLGERCFRKSYRNIEQQDQLCSFLFDSPDGWQLLTSEEVKSTDIVCDYEVSKLHPFYLHAFVSPLSKVEVVEYSDVRKQWRYVCECSGLPKNDQDLAFQFYIGERNEAPWPPHPYFVIEATPDISKEIPQIIEESD